MLSPPYALIPQYLITGYYKPATILRSGLESGAAVAATPHIYCEAGKTGGVL
jgi:hypothetical protein